VRGAVSNDRPYRDRRETGSSNFGDRVDKRFWNIPESNPTEANYMGSFAAENGAGSKGEMGEGW
jgi:hypothetical protein